MTQRAIVKCVRVLLAIAVLCGATFVYAQPQPTSAIPPDAMTLAVYSGLFHAVAAHEFLAARSEAAGTDPQRRGRKWLQELTGLTDQEYAKVRPLVLDGIGQMQASLSQVAAVAPKPAGKTAAAAAAAAATLTPSQKQQIGAMNTQREAMVMAHVKQLQATLGSGRFTAFDAAVRVEMAKHLVVQALPAPKN